MTIINVTGASRVPILHDVRNVTLSRNGRMVLISYENGVSPQRVP